MEVIVLLCVQNKFSQLMHIVITCHLLRQLGNLMFWSSFIFPSFAMSGIPVRLVWFISGILSDWEGISCAMLCFMAVNTLVGTCLDYLDRLQCVKNHLARVVANTTRCSCITPVRLFIGCLSSIILFLRWPYLYTSFYKVVS